MKRGSSGPPIRYDALSSCLALVAAKALESGASVHMPAHRLRAGGRGLGEGRAARRGAYL